MSRWKPDPQNRLAHTALELYAERGFEQTTVAEIAQRAGLTERTYFRHFADKREVLFSGADELEELLVQAVTGAPATATPIGATIAAFETVAVALFSEARRDYVRQRHAVIVANAALQERELSKLASLSAALTIALSQRGLIEPVARLTAEVGVMIFKVAIERWVSDGDQRDMVDLLRESVDGLKAVTAGI